MAVVEEIWKRGLEFGLRPKAPQFSSRQALLCILGLEHHNKPANGKFHIMFSSQLAPLLGVPFNQCLSNSVTHDITQLG